MPGKLLAELLVILLGESPLLNASKNVVFKVLSVSFVFVKVWPF